MEPEVAYIGFTVMVALQGWILREIYNFVTRVARVEFKQDTQDQINVENHKTFSNYGRRITDVERKLETL